MEEMNTSLPTTNETKISDFRVISGIWVRLEIRGARHERHERHD